MTRQLNSGGRSVAVVVGLVAGTHTSNAAVRFQEFVMPFFSKTLSFEAARR